MDAGEPSRQRFDGTDLAGAVFRDVDLSGATITGLISGLTINEVEVEPLITAELDRRHPERILLRSDDPDDLRQGWSLVRDQWTATIQRVEQLPPSLQRQRVDGEWSVLETLRHLVFVADDWFGRTWLNPTRTGERVWFPRSWSSSNPTASIRPKIQTSPRSSIGSTPESPSWISS
jgi:hypothetical protein